MDHLERGYLFKWSTIGDRKSGCTIVTIFIVSAPSTAVHLLKSSDFLEPFGSKILLLGGPHCWWVIAGVVRWHRRVARLCHIIFLCIFFRKMSVTACYNIQRHGQYNLIRFSLVGYLPILGSIGVGKSVRSPLTPLVVPTIFLVLLVVSTVGSSRGTTHLIC